MKDWKPQKLKNNPYDNEKFLKDVRKVGKIIRKAEEKAEETEIDTPALRRVIKKVIAEEREVLERLRDK